MKRNPEAVYRELGRLIETMPDLTAFPVTPDVHQWVGRAFALVQEVGNPADASIFSVTSHNLGTTARFQVANELTAIVYRALAVAERNAPLGIQGAFIPVGNNFDVFATLTKLLSTAQQDVLIVDPYMDEVVLTDFAVAVPNSITLRLLTDEAYCKPTFHPAVTKWVQQYGASRPLAARLSPAKTLHDRAIFVDGKQAWTLTQSIKDFAKRSPAEIVRVDIETGALKIAAYESMWTTAAIVA